MSVPGQFTPNTSLVVGVGGWTDLVPPVWRDVSARRMGKQDLKDAKHDRDAPGRKVRRDVKALAARDRILFRSKVDGLEPRIQVCLIENNP